MTSKSNQPEWAIKSFTHDMDSTNTATHVSLCAGYGGIDLGLKRAIPSLRTIAFSEIEAFAVANLVSKMEAGHLDPAPVWSNLKTFPWDSFRGKVGILSGGYPCQPFSSAGKRLGADDPRHLWPFIADGIARMRPDACFFENVEGHITLGMRDVLHDLAGLGYRTTWGVFSASEVGAPHQRKRVFILAHRKGTRLPRHRRLEQVGFQEGRDIEEGHASSRRGPCWPSRPSEPQHGWEPPRVVGNTPQRQDYRGEPGDMGLASSQWGCGDHAAGSTGQICMGSPMQSGLDGTTGQGLHGTGRAPLQSASGREQHAICQAQPPLGGDADGPAGGLDYAKLCVSCDNRTDELRLLGNGVVPAVAHRAFVVLAQRLTP